MKRSFLNYYKSVLEKVYFERQLFRKEYKKALDDLTPEERQHLNEWLYNNNLLQAEEIPTSFRMRR